MISKPRYGHYLTALARQATRATYDMWYQTLPEMDGIMVRYDWRLLEAAPHRYTFGPILADLDWAAERGLKLVIMPEDKSFGTESPVPDYLLQGTVPNRTGGRSAVRWDPHIAASFQALLSRLSHLSTHPAWEGLLLMETAPSIDDTYLKSTGYSPELYAQTYLNLFKVCDSRIFWQANFIPPRNELLIDAVMTAPESVNVHVGGPDCLPLNQPLVTRTYPVWQKYQNNFVGMSLPCYTVEGWPIERVLRYGQEVLKAKWVFWTYQNEFTEQTRLIKLAHH